LGKGLAYFAEGSDVVFVGMRDEEMAKSELVFVNELEDGIGFPAGVEEGGLRERLRPR